MNDDDWDFFNKSVGKLEKEVITLKKENERLKESIHSMLFTDDVVQDRYDKAKKENAKLKELLKECRRYIQPFIKDFTVTMPNEKIFLQELLTKIDEALQ